MPNFLIAKLKKEYPDKPSAVYGTLNNLGFMHGNKETEKGKEADAKHVEDVKQKLQGHLDKKSEKE